MNETHPFPGETLLIRIGYAQRANTPYFPPTVVMDEYLRFSNEHDGHVLYPIGAYGVRTDETADRIILWTMKHDMKMVAEIHSSGAPYSPAVWDSKSPYQVPKPWDRTPARKWLALDGMRPLEGFDPSQYDVIKTDGDMPLPDVLERMPRLTVLRITPAAPRG